MLLVNPSIEQIVNDAKGLNVQENETLLILMGEHATIDIEELIVQLNTLNVKICGAIFPSVISENEKYDDGIILNKYALTTAPVLIHGLNTTDFELPEFSDLDLSDDNPCTTMVWVDGLTSNIATFLNRLYNSLGNSVNYIGGGGGSLTLEQQPCVFTNEGIFQDVALIMFLDMNATLGVRHGWKKLHGPIVSTRTAKNVVEELNWQNAFKVYQSTILEDSGLDIQQDNFFDIAKGYPFGIFKEGSEDIVRDPITVSDEGHLVCVGEVPENTVLYILKGENDSLINSAKQAAEDCIHQVEDGNTIKNVFIVDCISRVLFLQDEFTKELKAITSTSPDTVPEGVLSLGEISSSGEGILEFFNKTIVIGALY